MLTGHAREHHREQQRIRDELRQQFQTAQQNAAQPLPPSHQPLCSTTLQQPDSRPTRLRCCSPKHQGDCTLF